MFPQQPVLAVTSGYWWKTIFRWVHPVKISTCHSFWYTEHPFWYTCPFLFSFFVFLLSWWQGEWGKNAPLLFVFQRAYRVLCKKCSKSERWDKNDQWKTNKCLIQCLWVIFYVKSCFWEEEMWVKRRSIFEVFEGKPFFWIWRMNVTRRWWEKRILVLKKTAEVFEKLGSYQR